jgi:ADP-heptose:LPS heptosyltransferase
MKILIIRPAALGDTLMLLPAIARLKRSAGIVFVGRAPGADYLKPHVDACIDYDRGGWHSLFVDGGVAERLPPIPPVHRGVVFLRDPEGLVMKNLGALLANTSLYRFPPFPPEAEPVHVALYLAACLEKANCPLDAEAAFKDACHKALLQHLPSRGSGRDVVFHPASGGAGKTYPPPFWTALIRTMKGLPLFQEERFLTLLGPAEETLFAHYQKELAPQGVEILVAPGREKLCAHLAGARLYVGPDSGITHLAAMHGAPTIALFKNTPVLQWKPLGPKVRVLENQKADPFFINRVLEAAVEWEEGARRKAQGAGGVVAGCKTTSRRP